MRLYIKQCRPYQVSVGGQGFSDTWIPLEDWQNEDNEEMLREKYPDKLLQKKDAWSILKFQYRYIDLSMVKDIVKYNEKEYQLSTVLIENMDLFETMIFPIENGVVSGNEVYCFRTLRVGESQRKHADIYYHPERYVSDEAIEQYLACKVCREWCCTLCKYSKLKFRD